MLSFDSKPTRRFLTLLYSCSGNRDRISDMACEAISATPTFKQWMEGKKVLFTPAARIMAEKLRPFTTKALRTATIAEQYSFYNNLQEFDKLAHDSEEALKEGNIEKIGVLHNQWQNYCVKRASMMLHEKLHYAASADIKRISGMSCPDKDTMESMVKFMADLSSLVQRQATTNRNITNFHIFNCFDIFTKELVTEMPPQGKVAQFRSSYKVYFTAHEFMKQIYPDKLFCIQPEAYTAFVRELT